MRSLRRLVSLTVSETRRAGVRRTAVRVREGLRARIEQATDRRFDRRFGTDTAGLVPLERLTVDSPNAASATHYQPIGRRYFLRMLNTVQLPPDSFVFVDLGSGKGRALLYADAFAFRRIVGVEFALELHRTAEQNISRYLERSGRTARFELHHADADCFTLPDEPLALFLYNPFGEEVLARVIVRLTESLALHPRPVAVFYRTPRHAHLFEQSSVFVPIARERTFAVYGTPDIRRSGT
jgi:hypothetical protein